MRSVIWSGLVVTVLKASACSAGDAGSYQRLKPDEKYALSVPRQTRGLVRKESRITAYVRGAQRLSVIDPMTEREVWGETVGASFSTAIPIAAVDGVALVGERGLRVISSGARRDFAVSGATGAFDAATATATFVAITDGGLRVARSLGSGGWQDVTLPGAFGESAQALVSADGSLVVTFAPGLGVTAVFAAADSVTPLAQRLTCPGAAPSAAYVAAYLDDASQTIWLGDAAGGVWQFASDACGEPASIATLGHGVARIVALDKATVAVTQEGGGIALFNAAAPTAMAPETLATTCDFPLAPVRVAASTLAFFCLDEVEASTPTSVAYRSSALHSVDATTGVRKAAFAVDLARVSAITLVPDGAKALVLGDDALGTMTKVDLENGQTREIRGLFLNKVLDEL